MGSGQIAAAFLKAEDVALRVALLFQTADDLADVLEAGQAFRHFRAVTPGNGEGQIAGDDGLDHHRVFRHGAKRRAGLQNVFQQQ